VVALAMAMQRSSSMGPSVNPFWSQRTQERVAVQQARPVDLPVPSGDDEDLDGSTGEQPLPVEGLREITVESSDFGRQLGKGRGELCAKCWEVYAIMLIYVLAYKWVLKII